MPESQQLLGGPYLSIAVLCEKVLRERDNVISVIRIIDRLSVIGRSDEMPPTTANFTLLLGFKSGILRGSLRVRIVPRSPSGRAMPSVEFPMLFEGDDERGVVIAAETTLALPESGLYWFEVYLAEEIKTRIPLRVVYQKTGQVLPPE